MSFIVADKPGRWSSGEEGIIELDAATGVAVAIATGRALVYHSNDGLVDTHTEVGCSIDCLVWSTCTLHVLFPTNQISVAKVQNVIFNITGDLPTYSNALRPDELGSYQIMVDFQHEHGTGDFTPLTMSPNKACTGANHSLISNETTPTRDHYLEQVAFECVLELHNSATGTVLMASNFIQANSLFNSETGDSACVLSPVEDLSAVESLAVMDDLVLTMRVKAMDYNWTYEVLSEQINIPFVPAFFIGEKEVNITGADLPAEVIVSGLPKQLHSIQVCVYMVCCRVSISV